MNLDKFDKLKNSVEEVTSDYDSELDLAIDLLCDVGGSRLMNLIRYVAAYRLEDELIPDDVYPSLKIDAMSIVKEMADNLTPKMHEKLLKSNYYGDSD